jgi:hypothetical protein
VVVAVVGVPRRRQEPETPPAPLRGEREHALERSLRHDREVDDLDGVLGGAVELVEERDARGARPVREQELGRLAGHRPWARVPGIARKHEGVDRQRVLSGCKELGQAHVGRKTVGACPLEDVVLRNDTARWQRAPRGGHRLRGAAELDLLLEQAVARGAVFG